eukprot:TRINITY_DN7407_c0_g1_i2.p1 TRINITY_DN7407_c0_g1~~TRINITY_DN7407_c0_g1_i2.p1  ORF type:complete len:800 (-),score=182.98 TRINITY_DN7407_c0_g1_i2:1333-3732(-)
MHTQLQDAGSRKGSLKKAPTVPLVYFTADPPATMTLAYIENLITQFKKGYILSQSGVAAIIERFSAMMDEQVTEAVLDITIPEDGSVCVIGDTHGQFVDLLTIFRLNGLPSEKTVYLFNGDYVDRGLRGVEICMILFCFKLLNPKQLFMNRGNHECKRLNEKYYFEQEVGLKYDATIFEAMQNAFTLLPLASLVNKKIFVVHGGLTRHDGVKIDEMRKIEYRKQCPKKSDDVLDQYFEDMMWSDPRVSAGREKNSRGAGIVFGPDVTEDFMRTNDLSLIIRSHELVPKGYYPTHDHQIITLFSASNYCGTNDNYGAFAVLKQDLVPVFTRYHADPVEGISSKFDFETLKIATFQLIRDRIFHYRRELMNEFAQKARDNKEIGISHKKITRQQWVEVVSKVIAIPDMPWLWLQPHLAKASHKKGPKGETLIGYKRFLERYRVMLNVDLVEHWEDMLLKEVCQALYRSNSYLAEKAKQRRERKKERADRRAQRKANRISGREDKDTDDDGSDKEKEKEKEEESGGEESTEAGAGAEKAFKSLSRKTGKITKAEFVEAMKGMSVELTGSQLLVVASKLDDNKDDSITYDEFMTKFKVLYHDVEKENREREKWMKGALRELGDIITQSASADLHAVFDEFDKDKSGALSYEEFSDVLKKLLGSSYDGVQRHQICAFVDKDGNGVIDWKEFTSAIKVDNRAWQREAVQSICNVLFRNRYGLQKAFRTFDLDGSGAIDVDEFCLVIKALNKLIEPPLSSTQVRKLHKALDTNGDGTISYDEFVEAFHVIDTGDDDDDHDRKSRKK